MILFSTAVFVVGMTLPFYGADPAPVDDRTPANTSAQLWSHMQDLRLAKKNAGSKNEQIKACQDIVATGKKFIANYPADVHAIEVQMLAAHSEIDLEEAKVSTPSAAEELNRKLKKMASDPSLSRPTRGQARMIEVEQALNQASTKADWDRVDAMIARFQKDFGPDFVIEGDNLSNDLQVEELESLQQAHEMQRSDALLHRLASSKDADIAAFAQETLAQATLLTKLKQAPLNLKFEAVDGKQVDLAAMRGKVVLIDFWATWCPDCRLEVPEVVATYQKYHPQGFEVVGISLDKSKAKMLAYMSQHGMTWAQDFDGLVWDNAISKKFYVHEIPTMWLVDKRGMLAVTTTDSDYNLAGEVGKLLKE